MRKLLIIALFGSLFTITTPQSTFNNSREEPVQVFNSRGNELIGEPSVECSVDRVIIKLKTNRPFWGRIYAAGHSKDSECLMDYSGDGTYDPELIVRLQRCGMQRERRLSPTPGLIHSLVMVVSFHSLFMTGRDRAFALTCYYAQQQYRTVDGFVTVDDMTTIVLPPESVSTTKCTYHVRHDSLDGREARVATLGSMLYHTWTCDAPDLRILVKSCMVSDGSGEEFMVIDENGCAIDPSIVGNLAYSQAGTQAWVPAAAFKFSDSTQMGIKCTVELCSHFNQPPENEESNCKNISPPRCGPWRARAIARASLEQSSTERSSSETQIDASPRHLNEEQPIPRRRAPPQRPLAPPRHYPGPQEDGMPTPPMFLQSPVNFAPPLSNSSSERRDRANFSESMRQSISGVSSPCSPSTISQLQTSASQTLTSFRRRAHDEVDVHSLPVTIINPPDMLPDAMTALSDEYLIPPVSTVKEVSTSRPNTAELRQIVENIEASSERLYGGRLVNYSAENEQPVRSESVYHDGTHVCITQATLIGSFVLSGVLAVCLLALCAACFVFRHKNAVQRRCRDDTKYRKEERPSAPIVITETEQGHDEVIVDL